MNHAVTAEETQTFVAVSQADRQRPHQPHRIGGGRRRCPREDVTEYVRTREFKGSTMIALRQLVNDIGNELSIFKQLKDVPRERTRNFRNDMYLVSEALRLMQKSGKPAFNDNEKKELANYKKMVDHSTRFIPTWVKVAVALALGLGTMVGWKRIVVTVGEKIGKNHLTYAQGAAAEITAMATIGAADGLGLPVSTTHVLSSGVAGTMAANRSGLQWGTMRNLLMAWVLTLPVSMLLVRLPVLGLHLDEDLSR